MSHNKSELIPQHPWARIIKDVYSLKIKHAHNSVHNPTYPQKKEKHPEPNRLKFTIIGDRVAKEYMYCMTLVKGLHKYRWKYFDAPVIRGVTTVEWPSVWNDLKIKYGGFAYCLRSKVAVLINDNFLGGEEELKELIETKYTYHLCHDYYKEGVAEFAKFIRSSGRPCAYMHISINAEHIGTLIFMLYSDIVPYTCENFLRLCKEKRGGYGGTPVHRIVKDGWIQCGGFGLKSTELACENFIVPHDRRGVLGMANNGRHIDCSTQFFVALQPAPWMAFKYVAFGQLIEGEATLQKIENVPTWYESPNSEIIIYQAGIFNMDCHDIMINRGAKEYIQGHIEDLIALGELLYEALIDRVFLEAELRDIERLREQEGEGAADVQSEEAASGIHATERFHRNMEDIKRQIEKSKTDNRRSTIQKSQVDNRLSTLQKSQIEHRPSTAASAVENNEFDVEEYKYEPEEYSYKHVSLAETPSLVVKPENPFYIPLTDVPYPGEIDSDFNLRRFLQGDYCLESDLEVSAPKEPIARQKQPFPVSVLFEVDESDSTESQLSLDSDDEKEIQHYIKYNVDRVSFAGGIIRNIAKERHNIFEGARQSELITDEVLRRVRLAAADLRSRETKKVSISAPTIEGHQSKIKRRQTGFVRPEDLEKIHIFSKTDEDNKKVRIAKSVDEPPPTRPLRRPTGFVRVSSVAAEADTEGRQSVLTRLYDEVSSNEEPPTLKDYKPTSEPHQRNTLLTFSLNTRIKSDEGSREKYQRHSMAADNESFEQILNLQHGKSAVRKISSDYVKTIDRIEHKLENSIRSVEFAKIRPTMSVSEYQMKNKKYQEDLKRISNSNTTPKDKRDTGMHPGLRLPGDSPLYSMVDVKSRKSIVAVKSSFHK